MKKKKVLILDQERIAYKLRRMAYEIWERNSEETAIVVIGIDGPGAIVAASLCNILKEISPLHIKNITVAINKKRPVNCAFDFDESLDGKAVVVVDDVANSGRTLMYSMHGLLSFDLKKVMVAVLVDRTHKSFPIASDIVGHTVATTIQEHIEVETKGDEVVAVYLA